MTIAYLTSRYPAISHTFVLREVQALRQRGIRVATFSVRRTPRRELLDPEALAEAESTRSLLPPPLPAIVAALVWAIFTRPFRLASTALFALTRPALPLRQRLLWGGYFCEAVLLAWWMHRSRCGRLHCHFGNSGSSTGMFAARLAGIPFSLTCHGSELLEPGRYRLAEKVHWASFVICVSRHGRSQLMLLTDPREWSKLHVIHCGLDPAAEPHPGPDEEGGILCVGRLAPEKGHLVLLDALVLLRERGVTVRCRLVGEGPMRSAIESRAAVLDIRDQLTLMGAQGADQVMRLYPSAAMVVLPSLSEGIPVTLMEAMRCGLPVVASRVGGVAELVRDHETGLVVAPGYARELADAIQWVLEHPASAAEMGQRAVRMIDEQFNLCRSADALSTLFFGGQQQKQRSSVEPRCSIGEEVPA